jgi:hypothetical protein
MTHGGRRSCEQRCVVMHRIGAPFGTSEAGWDINDPIERAKA